MKKVLVTYNVLREHYAELEEKYAVTFPEKGRYFKYDEVLAMISEYDALCPMFNFPVNKELINRGVKLQIVANYAVGFDNIDVTYAKEKGIVVANTPGPTTDPTANLAMALLLDTALRVSEYDRFVRTIGGKRKLGLLENLGVHVTGATLGIIGMGRIGKAMCKRARAFGMDVVYHDRQRLDLNEETNIDAAYVTMNELLRISDFVSVHAPYSSETYHLIGTDELKKMKPSAILINTARGPLVDEKALIEALQEGVIRGAGLDVFECNDLPSPELLAMEQVVITPHVGTQTTASRIAMAKAVCNNVIGYFENDRPVCRVLI